VVVDKNGLAGTSNSVFVTVANSAGGGGGGGGGGFKTKPPVGSAITAEVTNTTKFQIAFEDLSSAVANCISCSFQSSADMFAGQVTEVQLDPSSSKPLAVVVTLKQGAINGKIASVGTNQFVLSSVEGSPWPSTILVLTSNVTEFLGSSSSFSTLQAGQIVAVRGLLFKSGPANTPTLIARRVRTQ
jgi:hypothetical protein